MGASWRGGGARAGGARRRGGRRKKGRHRGAPGCPSPAPRPASPRPRCPSPHPNPACPPPKGRSKDHARRPGPGGRGRGGLGGRERASTRGLALFFCSRVLRLWPRASVDHAHARPAPPPDPAPHSRPPPLHMTDTQVVRTMKARAGIRSPPRCGRPPCSARACPAPGRRRTASASSRTSCSSRSRPACLTMRTRPRGTRTPWPGCPPLRTANSCACGGRWTSRCVFFCGGERGARARASERGKKKPRGCGGHGVRPPARPHSAPAFRPVTPPMGREPAQARPLGCGGVAGGG